MYFYSGLQGEYATLLCGLLRGIIKGTQNCGFFYDDGGSIVWCGRVVLMPNYRWWYLRTLHPRGLPPSIRSLYYCNHSLFYPLFLRLLLPSYYYCCCWWWWWFRSEVVVIEILRRGAEMKVECKLWLKVWVHPPCRSLEQVVHHTRGSHVANTFLPVGGNDESYQTSSWRQEHTHTKAFVTTTTDDVNGYWI